MGLRYDPEHLGVLPWVVHCGVYLGPDYSYILQGRAVNRVQVVLSGFSMRFFVLSKQKLSVRYGCLYFLAALVLVCVDVMMSSA